MDEQVMTPEDARLTMQTIAAALLPDERVRVTAITHENGVWHANLILRGGRNTVGWSVADEAFGDDGAFTDSLQHAIEKTGLAGIIKITPLTPAPFAPPEPPAEPPAETEVAEPPPEPPRKPTTKGRRKIN